MRTHWHSASPGPAWHSLTHAQHIQLFFFVFSFFVFFDNDFFALFALTNKNRLAGESVGKRIKKD